MTQAAVAFGWNVPSVRTEGGSASFAKLALNDSAQRAEKSRRVSRILKARRARAKFFDGDLFADPAWDMLLELYASELAFRRLSVSALCLASDVPATTALRWIQALERRGLVERRRDPHDGRRFFVKLTELGSSSIEEFFQSTPFAEQVL